MKEQRSRTNDQPQSMVKLREASKSTKAEADALFLSIGEGAIVTDSRGKISRMNKVAEKILGLNANEVIGKWYPDVVTVEDEEGNVIPIMERPIVEVFIAGKPIFRKLYVRKNASSRVALAMTVSPVLENGKPIGALEIFRDISDEVRLEKAKNEFIALASHQLRTPATAVKQYLSMLLDGYAGELTKSQKQFLSTANEGNNRQLRIIDDILKVAAADTGDMVLRKENLELTKLIQTVLEDQAPRLAKTRQRFNFIHPEEKIYAKVDENVFRMVIENLIDNAHKYTYPDKNIEVSLWEHTDRVTISVKDQGVGIRQSDLSKLFQKFIRLESPLSVSAGGTGLGLYWVKRVLELHGATIRVKSKVGEGTTFTIALPR